MIRKMKVEPKYSSYDVIIVGGAMMGSSIAWFLTDNSDFNGRILVIERDPTYQFSSTAHTNSCMRQQFSTPLNIKISQFGADFVTNMRGYMGGDERVPNTLLQNFGYMYLANERRSARALKKLQKTQIENGANTLHMSASEIKQEYSFYNVDDILAGNHNLTNEGYFDSGTLFDWWKRQAQEREAEYIHNEVVGMELTSKGDAINAIILKDNHKITCGHLINCTGPRAALTAAMAGISLPVEPRKRYTFIFDAAESLGKDLPLTIDPSGIHVRTDGVYYMAGCAPDLDLAVDPMNFSQDHSLWESKVWPLLAHRIPKFEAIKLINSWVGHYAYNTFDQNAVLGAHSTVKNFFFANGFSGHGLQQSPAIGRGIAEKLIYGKYRQLDLSPLGFERIEEGRPYLEGVII